MGTKTKVLLYNFVQCSWSFTSPQTCATWVDWTTWWPTQPTWKHRVWTTRRWGKQRRSLILPKLENCTEVRATILKDFEDICEQQPIGKTCLISGINSVSEFSFWISWMTGIWQRLVLKTKPDRILLTNSAKLTPRVSWLIWTRTWWTSVKLSLRRTLRRWWWDRLNKSHKSF